MPKVKLVGGEVALCLSAGQSFHPWYAVAQRKRGKEQVIEMSDREIANAITTVQKDSMVWDEQNSKIRKDGTVGTLQTDGSSPKHNNRIVEYTIYDDFNQRIRADQETVGTIVPNNARQAPRNGTKVIEEIKVVGNYSPSNHEASRVLDPSGLAPTVKENHGTVNAVAEEHKMTTNNIRIRRLTPRECWRLMGFTDEDFSKAEKVVSNTQLYKQAGNSICVPVLMALIKNLYDDVERKDEDDITRKNRYDVQAISNHQKMENEEGTVQGD